MLQTRVGKRTGAAALRMAVDMTTTPHIRLSRARRSCGSRRSTSTRSCTRSSTTHATAAGHRARRVAGRRGGSVVFNADDAVTRRAGEQ